MRDFFAGLAAALLAPIPAPRRWLGANDPVKPKRPGKDRSKTKAARKQRRKAHG